MIKPLTLEETERIAHTLAKKLMGWDEPIPPFKTRFPNKLESCLATPFITFAGKSLYPTLTDKATTLFYLMVKNHPFSNGNKRIAVTALFALLSKNGYWLEVDHKHLYKMAIFVAESDPKLKKGVAALLKDFITKNLVSLKK